MKTITQAAAAALISLGCALTSLPAIAATHYLTIVNDDAVSALAVEATPQGSDTPQVLDTAGALQGGRAGQATVRFPSGVCVVTLRVTYPDRGPLTITDWNVCRQSVIYLGQARRAGLRQVLDESATQPVR